MLNNVSTRATTPDVPLLFLFKRGNAYAEERTVNNLSRVAPLANRMDANDLKFSQSPYAIESTGSSVTSRVQRSSPQRHSPERAEAAPTAILEGSGEALHAGSPPQPWTSPQTEGDAAGAGVNQFGTNVHNLCYLPS